MASGSISEPSHRDTVTISGDDDDDDNDLVGEVEEEESEDDSDTESLLLDIVNGEFDNESPIDGTIPKDEAVRLQMRLREVGPNEFIKETLSSGRYSARRLLTAFGVQPPPFFEGRDDQGYFRLLGVALLHFLSTRRKLPQYNTLDDAVELLQSRRNIMVITGAGISTNLGVPDFRSKHTGFYDQMRQKGFESPEDVFDIHRFREDPTVFYSNSSPTLPEPSKSTPTHAFIKLLADESRLLTNYTQNIDNVEGNVGIPKDKLIQCHGSWATFTCTRCNYRTDGQKYYDDVKASRVVYCKECRPPRPLKRKRTSDHASRSRSRHFDTDDEDDKDGIYDLYEPGVMKPDITFFGEKLPDTFFDRFQKHDRSLVDLIIVIGTSMSVSPVSEIPMAVEPDVPQIVISRERVKHVNFDITLLGDCDLITEELARRVGWSLEHPMLKRVNAAVVEVDHELAIWQVAGAEAVPDEATEDKQEQSPEPIQV